MPTGVRNTLLSNNYPVNITSASTSGDIRVEDNNQTSVAVFIFEKIQKICKPSNIRTAFERKFNPLEISLLK